MDVIELDAASNNRVDDMRELVPRVYTAAADLRRKVFIIDEVQRIKEGWDVLLKTLEEPPDGRPVRLLHHRPQPDPTRRRLAAPALHVPTADERGDRGQARADPRRRRAGSPTPTPSSSSRASPPGACATPNRCSTRCSATSDAVIDAGGVRDLLGLAPEAAIERFVDALADGDALAGIDVLDQLEAEGRDMVGVLGAGRGPAAGAAGRRR